MLFFLLSIYLTSESSPLTWMKQHQLGWLGSSINCRLHKCLFTLHYWNIQGELMILWSGDYEDLCEDPGRFAFFLSIFSSP